MRKIILDFPSQFRIGFESAKRVRVEGKFKKVLICAMGGSALAGDVLKIWLESKKINLPLNINRDYGLPFNVDGEHLIFCISYSGNTEETLSSLKEALKGKLKVAAITSGGELLRICKKNKIPVAVIPGGYPPRMALGFQFASLMKILFNSKTIKDYSKEILSLERKIKPKKLEERGRMLAEKLKNKIPLIYASSRIRNIARIWKIKLNENSKVPAFCNSFPELNHNEMAGFEKNKDKFYIIILQDQNDSPEILKRERLTAEILRKKKIPVELISLEEKELLTRIFSAIILGDWASYYLALNSKVDPVRVKIIEDFKKKMQIH